MAFEPFKRVPYKQYAALIERMRVLESTLEEVSDWLCPHTEAAELWRELKGARREWCSHCNNYLRSDEDATLYDRVRQVIAAKGKVPTP